MVRQRVRIQYPVITLLARLKEAIATDGNNPWRESAIGETSVIGRAVVVAVIALLA